ncbi:MAG: 3-deoxy-D-manno-octulosonic acid transferase [Candidatus Rifleibacteriota bacterium]
MSRIYLKSYQWVLRAVVELLDLFPPRRIEKEEFAMRKGLLPEDYTPPTTGTIWIHGASLGEFITLKPFLQQLAAIYGKESLVCTATTMDGLRHLRKEELCGLATLLPIELPAFTVPFIEKIRPRVMLISETEIWPLLLDTLARKNVPYGIINGRINEKSVRLMRIMWPVFSSAVENFSFVFPQEKHYQRRFKILGVDSAKINTLGCFKYDFTRPDFDQNNFRQRFGMPAHRRVICFGSTHPGEEEIILDALEPLWPELNATVVIAPRHVKRTNEVIDLLKSRKLDFSLASTPQTTPGHVILVDTLGELRSFYAVSDLAFVGGSLIKRGGHNLMEPAACAVPILTGPETFNFRYEMMALNRERAVITVTDADSLQKTLRDWLNQPEDFADMGRRARKVLDCMAGASGRTIEKLQQLNLLP